MKLIEVEAFKNTLNNLIDSNPDTLDVETLKFVKLLVDLEPSINLAERVSINFAEHV